MKKVTTITLAGRAFQVDEAAYADASDYLEQAKKVLAKDPDQAEILDDLERSIADKLAGKLSEHKNVITKTDMHTALAALGPVEASDDSEAEPAQTGSRRLYRLMDGAVIAGVCRGFAVYFGVDVRIMYALAIILTILTHGLFILAYIVLALVLPVADDSEKRAAAYGYAATAREVAERARQRATDPQTLDSVGRGLDAIWRTVLALVAIAAGVGIIMLTVALGVAGWAVALGRTNLVGSLAHYNGWPQWLLLTAVYLVAVLPLVLVVRLVERLRRGRNAGRGTLAADFGLVTLWVLAVVSCAGFLLVAMPDARHYADTHHGYIDFGHTRSHICVEDWRCNPDSTSKVMPVPGAEPMPPVTPVMPVHGPIID